MRNFLNRLPITGFVIDSLVIFFVPGEDKWDTSECHQCKLGLINSQGCQGAPAYGGSPHFYNADPKLSQAIDGLNPNHDDHGTFLNIEPYSGVAFQAHKRIQVTVVHYFTPLFISLIRLPFT